MEEKTKAFSAAVADDADDVTRTALKADVIKFSRKLDHAKKLLRLREKIKELEQEVSDLEAAIEGDGSSVKANDMEFVEAQQAQGTARSLQSRLNWRGGRRTRAVLVEISGSGFRG